MINSGTVRPGLSFQPHSPGLPQGHFGKSEDRTSCAVLPRRDTNTSEPVRESPQISLVAVLMVLCGLVWSRCVLSLKTNVSWISNATCGKVPRCAEWIEMGLAWPAFGEKAEAVVPGFPPHLSKLTPWAPRCSSPHVRLWSPFWDVHGAIECNWDAHCGSESQHATKLKPF